MTQAVHSTVDGVQVIGLCRFSVPSTNAYKVQHESIDERRAFLYDPVRLENRFTWFEHVNLPGIEAQKDPNFTYVVMVGEDLPAPFRARMEAHAARIPQLVIHDTPPIDMRKGCADAIERQVDPAADVVIQFRQDDDDGVATEFTRDLRRDFRKSKGIFKERGLMALDYSLGINLEAQDGKLDLVPRRHLFLGAAFGICTLPGSGNYVFDFYHNMIWQKMAAVTMPDAYMWARGAHGMNDCGIVPSHNRVEEDPEIVRQTLRKRFRIDLPAFKAALAALHADA